MSQQFRLTDVQRGQILAFKESGLSFREIGRRIGKNHSVVSRFLKDVDGYGKKKSPGRPKILTDRVKRQICRVAANSTKGSRRIRNICAPEVSHVTVWHALKNSPHLKHEKMIFAPTLKPEHHRVRALFADAHQTWTHEWDQVFCLSFLSPVVFLDCLV